MKEVLHLPRGLDGWVWRYRPANFARRLHRHEELEMNLVTTGSATYLVGDRRYDLRRNTQIWLFPEHEHTLLKASPDYEMWIAVFKPALLRRVCKEPKLRTLKQANPDGQFSRQLGERAAARLRTLFAELATARDDSHRFNAGLAYALLLAWSAHLSAEELTGGLDLHPAVERAAAMIRESRDQILSLEELADEAGLSPSRLSRLFKQQTGVPLVRYRQRACLERFLKLYSEDRDKNLMSIAMTAGFGSYPQFHRVFRQIMGYSPGQHMKRTVAE